MKKCLWSIIPASLLIGLAGWVSRDASVSAQERIGSLGTPQVASVNDAAEEAPPISPAKSSGPLSLDACLELGMQHQPTLDAANASLSAAVSGKRALDRLIIPRLFTPDLGVRKQQACLGITIASAGVSQAEADTRYAITRNYFTVQFIRSQDQVVVDVQKNLKKAYDRAYKLYKSGDVDVKITAVDLEAIQVQIAMVKNKKSAIDNGMLKALAALREAMGLLHDYPLEIAAVDLPPAVYAVKVPGKDKKEETEYRQLYQIDKNAMIAAANANRGEMIQASTASQVTNLEVQAQNKIRGWQGRTFASGADIHESGVPQGVFNNDYRPYAIGISMPPFLAGRKKDRMQRASDFDARAAAVVDKTTNLVALDVEAQYLKWQEAAEEVADLSSILKLAQGLPQKVFDLDQKNYTSNAIIQANITAIMVRTQLNDAKHMHALALAGLERATAGAFRVYPVPSAK